MQAGSVLIGLATTPSYQLAIVQAGALEPLHALALGQDDTLRQLGLSTLEAVTRCLTPSSRRRFSPQATTVIRGQTRMRYRSKLSSPVPQAL